MFLVNKFHLSDTSIESMNPKKLLVVNAETIWVGFINLKLEHWMMIFYFKLIRFTPRSTPNIEEKVIGSIFNLMHFEEA